MPPLRIGYVMQNGVPDLGTVSGPMLHVTAVVRGLRTIGHQVRVVTWSRAQVKFSDDLDSWTPSAYGFSTSAAFRAVERPLRRLQRVAGLPYWNAFESVRFADGAARALKGFDVLYERHGYLGYGGVIAAWRLGIPIVIELNGNILQEIDALGVPMSEWQRRVGRAVTAKTLRLADQVVVVSEALRSVLVDALGVAPERVTTVVNGANVGLFSRQVDDGRIRRALQLGAGRLITFVGTFEPWHGVEFLVDAFDAVRARCPDAILVLAGDGSGLSSVRERAERLAPEVVRWTGRLPQADVAALLAASDVLVAPYAYAHGDIVGTPLKIVEYMAAGKAIVASRAPIHEIVEDGRTGVRVEPASAAALSTAIVALLEDDERRRRLGAAARIASHAYSWDAVCQRLSDLLLSVTSR
jgi:glycosyltransferase involved in cell wall biosynthesis